MGVLGWLLRDAGNRCERAKWQDTTEPALNGARPERAYARASDPKEVSANEA